jgi:hypothetical protein
MNIEVVADVDKKSLAYSGDFESARENLKKSIKSFLQDNSIYNMMPTNSEVISR